MSLDELTALRQHLALRVSCVYVLTASRELRGTMMQWKTTTLSSGKMPLSVNCNIDANSTLHMYVHKSRSPDIQDVSALLLLAGRSVNLVATSWPKLKYKHYTCPPAKASVKMLNRLRREANFHLSKDNQAEQH